MEFKKKAPEITTHDEDENLVGWNENEKV